MVTVIGRDGEILSRTPQRKRSFEEMVAGYRRRIGLPVEQREDTFPIFAITIKSD